MALRPSIVMVCVAALLAAGGSRLAAESGRGHGNSWGDRPSGSGNWGNRPGRERGGIVIEPYIDLDLSRRREPDRNAPDVMMANIEGCAADGVRLFVDCLRGRASPVAIRRLEACLRSESIPDDLRRVSACLPR